MRLPLGMWSGDQTDLSPCVTPISEEREWDPQVLRDHGGGVTLDHAHGGLNSDPRFLRLTQELAVDLDSLQVQNGTGRDAKLVLNGLDLTLPAGKIYGLLGPSGSGKTTLLRCILGRKNPQKGLLQVLGRTPGKPGAPIPGPGVGYMPQELTLYQELTISETLHFFGNLSGMTEPRIQQRIKELMGLLDLPHESRLVGDLSGGQQRRVSLACALIHSPPLLILDEPTVGLDPLLVKKIWDHFIRLTRQDGVTVLVTTHQMEEVRVANLVGFMISGRMLAQDAPEQLLEDFKCDTLMGVFQQLCLSDMEARAIAEHRGLTEVGSRKLKDRGTISAEEDLRYESLSEEPLKIMNHAQMADVKKGAAFSSRLSALVLKNLIQMKRNKSMLLFALLTPALLLLLFGNVIGGDPFALPVAVVNSDKYPTLSQPFLETIPNRTILQRRYTDLDRALDSLERGEVWGVLEIGHNFSRALRFRFVLGLDTDDKTLHESTMILHVDSTNQQVKLMLQKTFSESIIFLFEKLLSENGRPTALAQLPIRIDDRFYGDVGPSITEFMAPGIILAVTFFMAMALTAVSTTREAREGTMERCLVAGVQSSEVILSHVLSQVCIMLVQMSLMLLVVFAALNYPLRGPLILAVGLTALQGLSGMTYGLAISSICSTEQTSIFLALTTFIANLLVSGIIWTIHSMPHYIRRFAYFLPQTVPTESLRCIMYRGWGLERVEVSLGFVISVCWPFLFLLFALFFFRSHRHR